MKLFNSKIINVFFGGLVTILALSSLTACETLEETMGVSGGNSLINNTTLVNQLVKGKTTMTDVRRLLGAPQSTETTTDGVTRWEYTRFRPEGLNGTKFTTLDLAFDKKNVLEEKIYSVTHGGPSGGSGNSDSTRRAAAAANSSGAGF